MPSAVGNQFKKGLERVAWNF